jgi:hypothetical protein
MNKAIRRIALVTALVAGTITPAASWAQWEIDFGPGVGGCPANKSLVLYWDANGEYQGAQCLLGQPA